MSAVRKNNFEELVNKIYQTHCVLQENAAKAINYNLKGFSISALKNHRTFYLYYPQISQSVIGLFESVGFQNNTLQGIVHPVKSQTVSGFLEVTSKKDIWLTASAKSGFHRWNGRPSFCFQISRKTP